MVQKLRISESERGTNHGKYRNSTAAENNVKIIPENNEEDCLDENQLEDVSGGMFSDIAIYDLRLQQDKFPEPLKIIAAGCEKKASQLLLQQVSSQICKA